MQSKHLAMVNYGIYDALQFLYIVGYITVSSAYLILFIGVPLSGFRFGLHSMPL